MMRSVRNVEVVGGAEAIAKRRFRSKEERRRIAEESLEPGASVAVIARSQGVNANQVFHWRKLLREGRLNPKPASTPLMPVRVAEVVAAQHNSVRSCSGTIQLEVGRARVRLEGSVDPESLRLILEHLGR